MKKVLFIVTMFLMVIFSTNVNAVETTGRLWKDCRDKNLSQKIDKARSDFWIKFNASSKHDSRKNNIKLSNNLIEAIENCKKAKKLFDCEIINGDPRKCVLAID